MLGAHRCGFDQLVQVTDQYTRKDGSSVWTPESVFQVGSKLWDVVSPWEQGSPEGQFSISLISVLADILLFQGAGVTSLPSSGLFTPSGTSGLGFEAM